MKKLSPILFIFLLIFGSFFTPIYSEEWNKERDAKITSKIDVETFWKQVKKTREIKYGKDLAWDINFDYCSILCDTACVGILWCDYARYR